MFTALAFPFFGSILVGEPDRLRAQTLVLEAGGVGAIVVRTLAATELVAMALAAGEVRPRAAGDKRSVGEARRRFPAGRV